MATQDETYQVLRKAFDQFDTNNDEVISPSELKMILKQLQINVSDKQLDEMIKQVDTNQNDKIEWSEFYTYMRSTVERKESIETIRASFKEFDLDGDGFVDASELQSKLSELQGQTIPEEEIRAIIASVDTNNDGKIDIEEFIKLMQE